MEAGRVASERRELERALRAHETRLEEDAIALQAATRALSEWNGRWASAISVLGAGTSLEPRAALSLLEELAALAERSERIDRLEQRISGIRRDEARLAEEVRDPAALLGMTVDPEVPDRAAGEIVDRFRTAERALEERERIELELRERETELFAQRERLDAARTELAELARNAGARDAAELSLFERTSARVRELRRTLEAIESTLVETSGGRSVVDLVDEARKENAPRLRARLDELERERVETEEQRATALDRAARAQAGLELHAEALAADAVQEEQALAAAVRDRVERYARLRVAGALLERAVERHRLRHQGPVLRRAAELFSGLTGGAYERLLVGRDDSGIVAVTPDGRELLPDALSEGARYQLYLSLRLSSIERHALSAEPMPLVLDDAIIHFDETRKLLALKVLHELSSRVQVLFFTHLHHDLTLARRVNEEMQGDGAPIAFHELAAERPRASRETALRERSP
jgi:uncharacterized protein YhaN